MTEGTPDERRPSRLNEEDEPDVEGHRFALDRERMMDHERRPHPVSEDEDEGTDTEGRQAP
jgi:hypothetical protein